MRIKIAKKEARKRELFILLKISRHVSRGFKI